MANNMEQLLKDVRTRLNAQLTQLGIKDASNRSIYIVPDIDFLPQATMFPCVCLKDSTEDWRDFANIQRETDKYIDIAAYAQYYDLEDSIVGRSDSLDGVLDIIEDIKTALTDFALANITGLDYARPTTSTPSEMFIIGDGSTFLQRKIITFKFMFEETV